MADLDIFSPPRDTLGLTPEDVAEAQGYSVLGPGYFAARRWKEVFYDRSNKPIPAPSRGAGAPSHDHGVI